MADVKMEEFLSQYYMQLHFNNMPAEVFAQFLDFAKKDDFRGNMKHWKKFLMTVDANGNLVKKDLPDPDGTEYHLDIDQWQKMFKEFRNAFRKMSANRSTFDNPNNFQTYNKDATDFLDEYFGPGKLFEQISASPEADVQLQQLKLILEANEPAFTVKLAEWGQISYRDLVDGLKNQKYNTDAEFQEKVKAVAQYIEYYKTELNIPALQLLDFKKIQDGFEGTTVSAAQLNAFRTEYDNLLRTLYKKDGIRKLFPSDKINSVLTSAKSVVDYGNSSSDDYVPPKRKDELTPWQQLQKDVGDTYADTLEKYVKFSGDRLFFSDQAKQIVSAIPKKVKPTDGIGAILSAQSDIEKNLKFKSPKALSHFKWFCKTMGELQNTMKKAFEGALRNGRQMRALIEEMILIAVRDGKEAEAKTAMEILSVAKYGYTTSKIMDTLGKEQFTIFSDGKLSWNKSEGVAFVTKAMDKSIKAAFMGIGYGITTAVNAINLSGSKFKGKRGRLKDAQEAFQQSSQDGLADLHRQQQEDTDTRNLHQQTLNAMAHAPVNIDETNIDAHRTAYAQNQATAARMRQRVAKAKQRRQDLPAEIQQKQAEIQQIQQTILQITDMESQTHTRIGEINRRIADPTTPPAEIPTLQAELNYLQNTHLQALAANKQDANDQINNTNRDITRLQGMLANIDSVIQARENALHAQEGANYRQDIRLTAWTEAKNTVDLMSERINKRDQQINNWDQDHKDKYMELMAYWDMLETGRNTKTGKMYNWFGNLSKKKAEDEFKGQRDTIVSDYLSGYAYTA